jgi:hypothetical protein
MQYRFRTLLIVLALGPPMLAGAWWLSHHQPDWQEIYEREKFRWEYAGKLWSILRDNRGSYFGDDEPSP